MGRPLNKKYFGNRNIGTTGTGDNFGIGGEGLAAYTLAAEKGSLIINNAYAQPVLVVPAPTIPSGVQATASVVWEIDSIVVTNGTDGQDYSNGAFTLTGLTGSSTAVTMTITATGSGVHEPQAFAYAARGSWTTIPTLASTYQVAQAGSNGLAQVNVNFRVKSITTVEKGSGYTGAETFSWDDDGSHSGTMPGVPTVALTADSGAVGSATNQENAIQISAFIPTANGGSSAVAGDIAKQVSGRRYKVKTAQGTGIVKLVAAAPAAGQANIIATDANGNTYYVTKLTAHRATLTRLVDDGGDSDWLFATGAWTFWSFDAASGLRVQIANA